MAGMGIRFEQFGSITGVTAGTGLSGGGDSGGVTLNVDAAQTGITSLYATDLVLGEDAQTKIDFETVNEIHFDTDNAERLRIDSAGSVFIGGTANGQMSQGLTVDQASYDDEIFSLKSSDITHGVTDVTDTDTFFAIRKRTAGASGGGAIIEVIHDDDNVKPNVLQINAIGGTADTTKSTSAAGLIQFWATEINGSAQGDVTANGNIVTMAAGASGYAQWILDAEGDTWQTGDITSSGSGAQTLTVKTTGSTSHPIIDIDSANASGSDGQLTFSVATSPQAYLGYDTSANFFVIGMGNTTVPGTNDGLRMSNATPPQVYIPSTTAASSASTGALVVEGGIGVGANSYFAGQFVNLSKAQAADPVYMTIENTSTSTGSANAWLFLKFNNTTARTGISFQEGDGSGSAGNMLYFMENNQNFSYFRFSSADTDGSATAADIWRVADGGEAMTLNANHGANFDYVCEVCGASDIDPFICHGIPAVWQEDVEIMDRARRGDEYALDMLDKEGVLTRFDDGWRGYDPKTGFFFTMSAMVQMNSKMKTGEQHVRDEVAELKSEIDQLKQLIGV